MHSERDNSVSKGSKEVSKLPRGFGHFLHVLQQSAAKLAGSWSRTGVRYVKSGHAHRPLSSYFHVGADQTLSSRARLPSSIKFDERPAILLRELKLLSARREGP